MQESLKMAAKKKTAKVAPKKAAAKKTAPAPKKAAAKKAAPAPAKKVAPAPVKKPAPVAAKPAPKPAPVAAKPKPVIALPAKPQLRVLPKPVAVAVAPAAPAKRPGMPLKLPLTRPVAAAAKTAKPKKAKTPKPNQYIGARKYTHLKLAAMLEQPGFLQHVRGIIGSHQVSATLLASELVAFLEAEEANPSEWKKKNTPRPDGQPKKRGRPSKADLEARANGVTPIATVTHAKAAIANVKRLMPKAAVAVAPKAVVNGASTMIATRPVLRLARPVSA